MMCGDIISIWNVQYVETGLSHRITTLSVALMSAVKKLERLLLKSTSKQIRVNYRNRSGLKAKPERCASLDIGRAIRVNMVQLYEPSVTRKNTPKRNANGILNIGIVGVAQMLAIWIGKLFTVSSKLSVISASYAERLNGLRLTIYSHYQKAVRTILITCNRYVNLVTLGRATDESHL